jgi:hypothetical protein
MRKKMLALALTAGALMIPASPVLADPKRLRARQQQQGAKRRWCQVPCAWSWHRPWCDRAPHAGQTEAWRWILVLDSTGGLLEDVEIASKARSNAGTERAGKPVRPAPVLLRAGCQGRPGSCTKTAGPHSDPCTDRSCLPRCRRSSVAKDCRSPLAPTSLR